MTFQATTAAERAMHPRCEFQPFEMLVRCAHQATLAFTVSWPIGAGREAVYAYCDAHADGMRRAYERQAVPFTVAAIIYEGD